MRSAKAAHSVVVWLDCFLKSSLPAEKKYLKPCATLLGPIFIMRFPLTLSLFGWTTKEGAGPMIVNVADWVIVFPPLLTAQQSGKSPSTKSLCFLAAMKQRGAFITAMNYFHYTNHYKTPSKEHKGRVSERSYWWGGFILNTAPIVKQRELHTCNKKCVSFWTRKWVKAKV